MIGGIRAATLNQVLNVESNRTLIWINSSMGSAPSAAT